MVAALPASVTPRSTSMEPACESATKRSPLGAAWMMRGITKVPEVGACVSCLFSDGCIADSVELDLKPGRGNGPRALRPLDKRGTVVYRLRRFRLWQVCYGDLSPDARLLLRVVGEGGLAGDRLLRMERRRKKSRHDERSQ